jgi:lysophospholipase L1-like esterase
MKIPVSSTLLFIGDSITDCEREWTGGRNDGLGRGYVSMVDADLRNSWPPHPLRILNKGIDGNQVTDLEARWDDDVLAHQPDWLSVMIGINDVCQQFDCPLETKEVAIGRFESVYRSLIERTRTQLKGLILMTPYFIEANREDPMRRMMDDVGGVVKRLAGEFDAVLVDVQAPFDEYLESHSSRSLADDRVHPNAAGHQIIAQAFLKALGR